MKAQINGICRGDGKIYAELSVEGMALDSVLSATATSKGIDVPCEAYETLKGSTGEKRIFVIVLPIMQIRNVALNISEMSKNEGCRRSEKFSFNFTKAKWESRLNYRLRKEFCKKIRDYDQIGSYGKIRMEFWECIADSDKNIIRGLIRMPYRENSVIRVECINGSLEQLEINPVFLSDTKTKSDVVDGIFFREMQFSIRVPGDVQDLIFTLADEINPELDSFGTLESKSYQNMLNESRDLMYGAQIDPTYEDWFEDHKVDLGDLAKQHKIHFEFSPLYSIVVPLFKTPEKFFEDMLNSVMSQSYGRWELILINASPDSEKLLRLIDDAVAGDGRVMHVKLESNLGISENTNVGIRHAKGDFICFFDHDDLLEPDLLFEYTKALNNYGDIDLLYCDEDKMLPSGKLTEPYFKPDFNIDLLRNNNYICHLLTIRKTILDKLEPNTSELDGAQDHNTTLQACEYARRIYHVARVLYHWRISPSSTASNSDSKPFATQAGIKAVQGHLDRLGIKASVGPADRPFTYRVDYAPPEDKPLVSIIIPSKDHPEFLRICIESIIDKTTYPNYEIVIVENNSTEQETFDYYSEIGEVFPGLIRIVYWPAEFNFSKLVNFGVSKARGDYLLLLNNDTEVITPGWIDRLVGLCSRSDVGVVGSRLYFKDGTIQHAGVCVSGGVAGHLNRNLPKGSWGYFALADATQDLSAVTAACAMTKRSVFMDVDGFTEELGVAFNDVDFCLKVRDKGLLVVYTPEVELFHYESLSRGFEDDVEKKIRFHREASFMNYKWPEYYVKGDPYMNPNFTTSEPFNCYYHL